MVDNLLPSLPVDDNTLHLWVPAIADTTAPKLTELAAAGAVDISCYLTAPWNAGGDQATIPDPRACGDEDFSAPGKVTRTLDLQYIENPGSTTTNKAYDTLVPGTLGFLVQRRGTPYDVPLAVGDKVDVWPVRTGLQLPVTEAGQVFRINQKMFPSGKVRQQVAVVA